ncbi:BLOC-1 related complex subunit 8 [Marchantia polymorpha subsp. ruderalis]|uniref:Protein MEF2BNB n=2 Tax=Marchantia polymorpha TaxID=3197 RepID=A0AAF6ARV1_MARPO|nr:hypothetical protein MARPO_0001s0271 [Marchantia polymorpha]BBM99171.1 hypothetical protein Mp_1g19330 [Marchantia polymorpha subsp. ruderalis]|eukprot:PTQ50250.1 hypothetical protein MARPO_0001s0271 [Marchantia polymorpha]
MHQLTPTAESPLREVHDTITEMMRQLANEPSVGLYFVQQHVHRAVPAMVQLKAQIVDTTQEAEYVTQDVRDALNSVKTMKECGPAVIERMMKTLDSSLPRLPSFRQTRRDELSPDSKRRPSLFTDTAEMQRNMSRTPSGREPPLADSDYTGYVRNIFDSAYQKASSVASAAKWTATSSNRVPSSIEGDHLSRDGTRGDEGQSSISSKPPLWNPDYKGPGQYVRGLFATDSLQPPESWGGWLPTQALRSSFSKIAGGKVPEAVAQSPPSEEESSTKQSLELDGDSYAAFAAERAAELEQWLDDTEDAAVRGQ